MYSSLLLVGWQEGTWPVISPATMIAKSKLWGKLEDTLEKGAGCPKNLYLHIYFQQICFLSGYVLSLHIMLQTVAVKELRTVMNVMLCVWQFWSNDPTTATVTRLAAVTGSVKSYIACSVIGLSATSFTLLSSSVILVVKYFSVSLVSHGGLVTG